MYVQSRDLKPSPLHRSWVPLGPSYIPCMPFQVHVISYCVPSMSQPPPYAVLLHFPSCPSSPSHAHLTFMSVSLMLTYTLLTTRISGLPLIHSPCECTDLLSLPRPSRGLFPFHLLCSLSNLVFPSAQNSQVLWLLGFLSTTGIDNTCAVFTTREAGASHRVVSCRTFKLVIDHSFTSSDLGNFVKWNSTRCRR